MLEDFGDWGDERFLGVCAEDWLWDVNERRQHDLAENRRQLLEDEVDDVWDRENERDLSDIVREQEESEDWVLEADDLQEWRNPDENDDYLDCSWEE